MPNWCNNTLEISHEDPAMMERVRKAFTDGRLLDEFIPVPKSLHIVSGRVGDDTDPKQIELEAQEKANFEAHGYATWYDYCVNEWGTKWDIGGDGMEPHDDGPNRTTLAFDSAWAPPCAAMDKLMDLGFSVRLYYYEPGMCFAGIYDENGDDYYDLGGMTSDQVAEEVPSELDAMFGISETMAEYEAEEAEEEENEENK
jgi:hypothetical protein